MDLRLSPAHLAFRDELRTWLSANLRRPWRDELRDPGHGEDSLIQLRRDWQRKLHQAGYLGLDWPREWGGRGATAAIQMHGGIGFTWEPDVHFYVKRTKTLEQHYGATATQLERALAAAGY